MKILVIGCNGQVGRELQGTLAPLGELIAIDYPDVDLTKPDSTTTIVRGVSPDLIINSAAYTAVDRAEKEPDIAQKVNADAPGLLAREAGRLGIALIHYSTDYVFDGRKQQPYVETDIPCPLNVYGKTKLAGEEAVRASGTRHVILRTSWVYSNWGNNFLLTMLRLASEREQLRVIADQVGTPTWARTLARITAGIVAREASCGPQHMFKETSGLYQATGSGSTSWYGLTQAIVEEYRQLNQHPLKVREVLPITTEEYPLPAARPRNSVLDNAKLERTFDIKPRPWRDQLHELMREMYR
jgi:dTDP-4-dehydrorhamnose reductase